MEKIKRTNFERIKMMSVDEMAEFLSPMDVDEAEQSFCMKSGKCPHESDCYGEDAKNRICYYVTDKPLKQGQRDMWIDWLSAEWEGAPGIPEDKEDTRTKDFVAYLMRFSPDTCLHIIIANEEQRQYYPLKGSALVTGTEQPVILTAVGAPEPFPFEEDDDGET